MQFGNLMINKKYITSKREPFFEIAREFLDDDSVVLDIGCGNGSFSDYFKKKSFFLYDGNKQTVASLKNKGHKYVFHGNLPNLPFSNEQFDLIHCSHVVEHLEIKQFYDSLKEMDRCLKSNGYLIISAPLMWDGFYDDLSHIRPYPPIVFKNYMCNTNTDNRTDSIISSNYTMIKEIYRYFEINSLEGLLNIQKNLLVKLYVLAKRTLVKLGLKQFKKTGYTIVLHKHG